MAKRAVVSVKEDLSSVSLWLRTKLIVPEPTPPAMQDQIRRIHRATFSLVLWRFRLTGLQEWGRVFVEEIASDALQVIPQAFMGYSKTTKLLTRGIVENALRHLYFSDHPVEFRRMNRDGKYYIQLEELFSYAASHDAFLDTEKEFDALNRLKSLYSELSAGVHGRQVVDLEMRVALEKIAYDGPAVEKEARLIERCAESVNFVLAVFHRDRFDRFSAEDRRVILQTMSTQAKKVRMETGG